MVNRKSKAIDHKGRPLVLYHGTGIQIHEFDPKETGKRLQQHDTKPKSVFFFTPTKNLVNTYTPKHIDFTGNEFHKEGSQIIPVYLQMFNPLRINAFGSNWNDIEFEKYILTTNEICKIAETRGFDSVIIKNVYDNGDGGVKYKGDVYAVFSPNQIKSVFNRGNYDIFNKNILEVRTLNN